MMGKTVVAAAALLLAAAGAWAHGEHNWMREQRLENPVTGAWCCDDRDCIRVATEAVRRHGDHYVIAVEGRTLLFPVAQVLPSRDPSYWLCAGAAGPRCFFVPGLGV